MASSENLASMEPWSFRSAFADSWISEAYARDTETLTKALQKSICNTSNENFIDTFSVDSIEPFLSFTEPETTPTPTVSGVSGSDPEIVPKRKRTTEPVSSGKVTKRKSRASKKSHTTFITADPANFRQMVQQVTGVRFGGAQMSVNPILKPEPQRPRLSQGCFLPTLDTSAFLLDHHQQQTVGTGMMAADGGTGSLTFPANAVADGGASVFDFESFPNFPTLESWKVL